ncbi:MAG: Sec-independent protein translocase protein TatB [Hyphomicrobiales bacterium]
MFDFGVGYSEIMVVAIVALIVIGPKDLPKVLRTIGQMTAGLRRMAGEFQRHLDDAMKEAGLDEVKREVQSMASDVKQMASLDVVEEMKKTEADIKQAMAGSAPVVPPAASSPATPPAAAPASTAAEPPPAKLEAPAPHAAPATPVASSPEKPTAPVAAPNGRDHA